MPGRTSRGAIQHFTPRDSMKAQSALASSLFSDPWLMKTWPAMHIPVRVSKGYKAEPRLGKAGAGPGADPLAPAGRLRLVHLRHDIPHIFLAQRVAACVRRRRGTAGRGEPFHLDAEFEDV